jgi:hypothetical protein
MSKLADHRKPIFGLPTIEQVTRVVKHDLESVPHRYDDSNQQIPTITMH